MNTSNLKTKKLIFIIPEKLSMTQSLYCTSVDLIISIDDFSN